MTVTEWVGAAVGVALVLSASFSIPKTLIVPRGLSSKPVAFMTRTLRRMFLFIANRTDEYGRKDRILVMLGPSMLLGLLFMWIAMFFFGYSLMLWPLIDGNFGDAMNEIGSSMLTLGYAAPDGVGASVLHFAAAATGLVVIALQIAYLPTIYGAFNRRETLVTMLQSRGGAPAWGPEILMRHHTVALIDNLPLFFTEWERWAADVAESHSSYPVLIYFRSPHPLRSWVVSLVAVMDAAALHVSLNPSTRITEARLCIRMGFLCLREIAAAVKVPFDADPFPTDPIDLSFDEFAGAVKRMEGLDYPMEVTAEEAWPHFRGWRVNYEKVAYALADVVVAPPGPWSGERTHLPGMAIVPQRPANRTPDQPEPDSRPRGHGTGH